MIKGPRKQLQVIISLGFGTKKSEEIKKICGFTTPSDLRDAAVLFVLAKIL